jgi:hypothetical protein
MNGFIQQVEDVHGFFSAFDAEQEEGRKQGFNNFNLFTTLLPPTNEVRLHSGYLHHLLNPLGTHERGSFFLERFLRGCCNLSESDITESRWSVKKEKDRVDVHISNGDYHIIIENKLYAGDQEKQLQRYIELVEKTAEPEKIIVVYLSLNRDKPSQYSLGDWQLEDGYLVKDDKKIQYINLHYQDKNEFNIHKWVSESKDDLKKLQLAHLDNVLFGLEQYLTVIKYLYGEKVNKIMTLADFIIGKENPDIYNKMSDVFSKKTEFDEMREEISKRFINFLYDYLSKKIDSNLWFLEKKNHIGHGKNRPRYVHKNGHGLPIRISQISDVEDGSKIVFAFEWHNPEVGYNPLFGIVRRNAQINIDHCKYIFKDKGLSAHKDSPWWLYSEYWDKGDAIKTILDFESVEVAAEALGEEMIRSLIKHSDLIKESNMILKKLDK